MSAGTEDLKSQPSGLASFDTMLYDAGAVGPAVPTHSGTAAAAVAAAAAPLNGQLQQSKPAAGAGIGQDSASASGQTQQSQGFMPYKWRNSPLPMGIHQLQPGGLLSMGKRSASASLAEPLRKRQASD